MFRNPLCLGLIGLLLCSAPMSADTTGGASSIKPRNSARPAARAAPSTKRVVWTLVGIGAGFGAGVFLGLHAFDDAINSDRKVWLSAIGGAAAGGLAAGLLSRNVGRAPTVNAPRSLEPRVDRPLAPSLVVRPEVSSDDDVLRRRVHEISR